MAILDIQAIEKILPHRYPFLLVDRIVELEDMRVVGIKNVTANEPHFTGHFPGQPVMPGVLIIEALAQTAGVLVLIAWSGSRQQTRIPRHDRGSEVSQAGGAWRSATPRGHIPQAEAKRCQDAMRGISRRSKVAEAKLVCTLIDKPTDKPAQPE